MKKALRIISISAGIVSVLSAVILACIYLEGAAEKLGKMKNRISAMVGSSDDDLELE